VLYPCDANQTARLVEEMADQEGIVYVRTTRAATPTVYGADEEFAIGGSRVLREGDDVAIVAAGITLHESLKAAEQLAGEGIDARVIDCYSVKPVDAETLRTAAAETGGRILTVEDHWSEGGIGDAVLEALSDGESPARVVRLAVREMPTSGKPAELLSAAGIDAEHIAEAARSLVGSAVAH
jgi:transketolase